MKTFHFPIFNNNATIEVLVGDTQNPYVNDQMKLAVSNVVGLEMHNEMIDATLQRPYLRVVFIGDLNMIHWKHFNNDRDCEFEEDDLITDDGKWIGKVVFMRGGLYNSKPNDYMSKKVGEYIKSLDNSEGNYTSYNEFVEVYLDNPWFRIILFNLDKMINFNNDAQK